MVELDVGTAVAAAMALVHAVVAAATVLDRQHRGFGVAHQLIGTVAVGRTQRTADAAGQRELRAVEVVGRGHRVQHAPRRGFGHAGVGAFDQQRELVAAGARQQVVGAHAGLDALRHVDQHAVAGLVAEAVVDLAEAVQVDQQQRETAAFLARTLAGAATCSASWRRFGRPVSTSVSDSSSMRCCAASCSLRSRNEYTRPMAWPRHHSGRVTRSSTCPECSVSRSLALSSVASWMACSRRW
jgi:hypothetical protein